MAQDDFTEANRELKRSARADKRKFIESLAEEAEEAAASNIIKQLYDTTKELSQKYSRPERPIRTRKETPSWEQSETA